MTMTNETPDGGRPLTGWHVLAIAVSAFSVIIGVNVYMASQAIGTFPGLETKNSYVASQTFDDDRAAQEALGWVVTPTLSGTVVTLTVTDEVTGLPANVAEIGGILGRATHVRDDQTPAFTQVSTGVYSAEVGALDFGKWELRLTAKAPDGTNFRQIIEVFVPKSAVE